MRFPHLRLLVVQAVALLALACLPAGALARAPAPPRCAAIQGETEVQNATWRVFRVWDGSTAREPGEPLWACRRGLKPARTLVRVALSGNRCDGAGCETTRVVDLRGDRLLVYEDGIAPDYGQRYRVIDLARRRSAMIGREVRYRPADVLGSLLFHWAHIAGTGSVFFGAEPLDSRAHGGFTVLDEHGAMRSSIDTADMQASRGGAGAAPGIYLTQPGRGVLRIAGDGAAKLRFRRVRGLSLRPNRMKASGSGRLIRRTIGVGDGAIDLVWRARGRHRAWLDLTDLDVRVRFAELAVGGGDATVLAAGQSGVLVRARFADRPHRLRARLYDVTGQAGPLVDLPPSAVPSGPGRIAITYRDALAVADGDRIRIWDPSPRSVPAPGAHDLVAVGRNDVYYTDGAGRPHRISLRDVLGSDPAPGTPFPVR